VARRPSRAPFRLLPRRWLRRGRRSLVLRWGAVAGAAALAAMQASAVAADAEAARDSWGRGVDVVVAARDLAAGQRVGEGDVRVESRPAAVVPGSAVDDPPLGRVVTAAMAAGEVVVADRVAPAGLSAAAARIPDGWRAVAVPAGGLGAVTPPLVVGDRVDLLAPDVVAEDAVVVAVADDAVTVAVPAADAPVVADALAVAVVTLALRGAG